MDSSQQKDVKEENKEEFVSKKSYLEVSSDMHKYKEKLKEIQAENNELKLKLESREKQELTEKQEFKTLYERVEKEKQEIMSKFEAEKAQTIKQQKLNAALAQLGKLAKPEFVSHLNLDAIKHLEDGQIDFSSLEAEVNRFRQEYPMCIQTTPSIPLPNAAPVKPTSSSSSIDVNKLSQNELLDLYKKNLKKQKGI